VFKKSGEKPTRRSVLQGKRVRKTERGGGVRNVRGGGVAKKTKRPLEGYTLGEKGGAEAVRLSKKVGRHVSRKVKV